MLEPQDTSHASLTLVFRGEEDDVIDELLTILKHARWENLEMHYELGNLSAERTDLHVHDFDGEANEIPLTFALSASWFTSDREVELMVEVNEAEQEWSYDECQKLCADIISTLSRKFPTVQDTVKEDHGDNGFNADADADEDDDDEQGLDY